MHVAVITFNPSQAHPFQKLSLMQKPVAINFVCICALVSGVNLNLALPCTYCEPINSVTSKLHTQAAPVESIHIHYTDHHGLSNCICPSLAIACRAVSCIVLFSRCAMQMFSSQHEKNMQRECWNQDLSECTDQPSYLACGQCNQNRTYLQGYGFIQPGKEQLHHNSETVRLQQLMLTPSYTMKKCWVFTHFLNDTIKLRY